MIRTISVALFFWISSSLSLFGQTDSILSLNYDIFAQEGPLEVTLSFDVKQFIRTKYKDQYQPAIISIQLNDSMDVSDTIRIKARGEFRKQHCSFPPIRLNFSDASLDVPGLNHLEKIKLVTHCKGSDSYQQYLIKEYLTYKAYNLLTDMSFRVRLVNITYVDSKGKTDPLQKMGFIIEDIDQLAERNNCLEFSNRGLHPELLDRDQMTLVGLFNFMIGNTDWHTPSLHNIRLLRNQDFSNDTVFPVPYDFDYSGLVNAVYAVPSDQLSIKSVRTRFYMGFERTHAELEACFEKFFAREDAIYALFQDCPYLEDSQKNDCVNYLQSYFELIRNDRMVQLNLEDVAQRRN